MSATLQVQVESELATAVAECYDDPLRFVETMYPWGQPGPLEHLSLPGFTQDSPTTAALGSAQASAATPPTG